MYICILIPFASSSRYCLTFYWLIILKKIFTRFVIILICICFLHYVINHCLNCTTYCFVVNFLISLPLFAQKGIILLTVSIRYWAICIRHCLIYYNTLYHASCYFCNYWFFATNLTSQQYNTQYYILFSLLQKTLFVKMTEANKRSDIFIPLSQILWYVKKNHYIVF